MLISFGACSGSKYTHRMGIERQNRRAHPKLPRPLNDGSQNPLMPEMEAIEISDRQHAKDRMPLHRTDGKPLSSGYDYTE